ncbi:hypothetical protein AWW72_13325 [Acinetobacter sp. NRRL B-65365]|uniref:hypothetical protein n=1 Tax=Acinetobacter sp. NRRL B-65365 TaxID=1785092 RepID=UPI0007A0B3BE|nr:hypothetical protein [Acinetobacter sp. NRRL B-65365]KYQ83564.1 hypothetical protein AWW72_13325 [Acinetobacter sp. NRRL B-65365]
MWWMALIQAIKEKVDGAKNTINNATTLRNQAETTEAQGRVDAQSILNQGQKMQSSARAAAAENGLNVDVGSAAAIQDQIAGDSAANAYITKSQANYAASQMRAEASDSLDRTFSDLGPLKGLAKKGWK